MGKAVHAAETLLRHRTAQQYPHSPLLLLLLTFPLPSLPSPASAPRCPGSPAPSTRTKYGGKEEEEGLDMEGGGRVGGERGYFFSGRHGHDKASLVSRRCHDLEFWD
ncbi:uncharacterized protein LOC100837593 isoform X3 [Brachypodium distachyon]|uniref:uncharacterized protein LOC100837593 isoform X3 n=1 Tax=Brachypodium distachyon TaxID=15368 RepID=UPI00071D1084|nr:uncharacterized protein LOC100837593 isoform X3 [Brachypodium distachyon]|eukprot:XP_014756402.1 uncharacterized protein LOC100837593 isoform X3 [Brachypodium distachyon]